MANYRAEHVRESKEASLDAAIRTAMERIRRQGGRIVDLKIAPATREGSIGRAIILYELEDTQDPESSRRTSAPM